MAERDRRGPGGRTGRHTTPGGSTRPREAPRPGRPTRSDGATVTVSAPGFVALSADQERRAVEALAELLVPMFLGTAPQAVNTEDPGVTASGDA